MRYLSCSQSTLSIPKNFKTLQIAHSGVLAQTGL